MKRMKDVPQTVQEYIAQHDRKVQGILRALRDVILQAAPGATEKIGYQMPAYTLNGVLVYFAAWEHHVGFYPGPEVLEAFGDEVAPYAHSKGTLQFPLDRPVPRGLVKRIVKFRVAMLEAKKAARKAGAGAAKRVKRKSVRRTSTGTRKRT